MASSSIAVIRWLLVIGALVFFLAQIQMFLYQSQCSDLVESAAQREEDCSQLSEALKSNLTAASGVIKSLRQEIQRLKRAGSKDFGREESRRIMKDKIHNLQVHRDETHRIQAKARAQAEGKARAAVSAKVKPKEHTEVATAKVNLTKSVKSKARDGSLHVKGLIPAANGSVVAAVVIMACNRADYLERTLKSVLQHHRPESGKFPLYISQDGLSAEVKSVAQSYPQFVYIQHVEKHPPVMASANENIAYYRISEHYKWALTQLFKVQNYSRVIILEDDMEIAPDFFDYFEATADLLDTDDSLLAISSWNDNGQKQFVHNAELLYRSDFFPGLGWMLTKQLWQELAPKWPKAYWDDWLRLAANRKKRQVIRPEVCRTYNFGEHGSSQGQFYSKYLAPIQLNQKKVNWAAMDLSYLLDVNYVDFFSEAIQGATKGASLQSIVQIDHLLHDAIVEYADEPQFQTIAEKLGIFPEWKDGVPRGAYQGVVTIRFHGPRRIFIVGPNSKSLLTHKPAFSSIKQL